MRQEFWTPLYFLTYGCWGYWQLKQWTGRFLSMWTGRSASFSLISGPLFLPLRSRPIAPRQQWICEGTPSTHTHLSGHPGCYLFQETFCDSSSLMASLLPQGEPQKHLVYLTYFLMFVLFWHGVHYRYSFIWGNSTSLTVKSLKAQIVYSTLNPILCPAVLNVCFLSSLEGKTRVFL